MTQPFPENNSWILTSTGTKVPEYVDEFALLPFFSALTLASKIKRKRKFTLFYWKFHLQNLRFQSRHVTTIFPSPYSLYTSINYTQRRQACAECLALWSDDLHPRTWPQGSTPVNTPFCIILPQGPRPVDRIDIVPIPIRRFANHRLPCHRENLEQWTPTLFAPLSQPQFRRPRTTVIVLGILAFMQTSDPIPPSVFLVSDIDSSKTLFFNPISHILTAQLSI